MSVVEFGVGGGAGLVALERAAEQAEELINVGIDVYGFDTGEGMPKPTDYRDRPYFWLEGTYPCDQQELSKRLSRARLEIGLVKDTIQSFLSANPSPICFVGFDVCFYSSTKDALSILDAHHDRLIPRIPFYFRSILGKDVSDFAGERLAISEFNAEHKHRKISPTYGLRWYVPRGQNMAVWPDSFLSLHAFDHPLYNEPQQLRLPTIIDVEGSEFFHAPRQWKGSL